MDRLYSLFFTALRTLITFPEVLLVCEITELIFYYHVRQNLSFIQMIK